jgi:hypothetical protein
MSIPQQRVDWQAYDAFEGSDADFARGIGLSPNNFAQYKRRRLRHARRAAGGPLARDTDRAATNGTLPALPAAQPYAAQRVTAQTSDSVGALAARVARLEAHQWEVDAWLATLQGQVRDATQRRAELRSAEPRSLAQTYAEPAQTWDDPDDAKAVPFNCSLPRGLKRLLDAEARRTGLPASRLVQRLLLAALTGMGGSQDA